MRAEEIDLNEEEEAALQRAWQWLESRSGKRREPKPESEKSASRLHAALTKRYAPETVKAILAATMTGLADRPELQKAVGKYLDNDTGPEPKHPEQPPDTEKGNESESTGEAPEQGAADEPPH